MECEDQVRLMIQRCCLQDKDKKKTPQLEMTRLKEGGGVEDEASEARRRAEREQEVLEQVLLPPKNVQLMEKIGAGAFGE